MERITVFIQKNWGLIVVFFLSLFAIKPFLFTGFFPMHDDTQVARVYEMWKALRDGMFPVRWVADLGYGYGYPIFNFYAPLAYYAGAFFIFLGFDALLATKLMMMLGIILSGAFMYMLAREFWGEIGGAISGLLYVFAPYHALEIYVRGDVAEFWAYALIPLMAFGFYKVFIYSKDSEIKNRWMWMITAGVSYAGIILSHNLTAMMVTPFLLIVLSVYCSIVVYRTKKLSAIYYLLLSIALGLLLSAFYWFPAILEMQYTNVASQIGGGAYFADHFVCFSQLWDSHWGFGGSAPGCVDGLSFKIGKLHIVLAILAVILFLFRMQRTQKQILFALLFSLFSLLISVFLMLWISKDVWDNIPFMAYFQYPWRFLILASFFVSFISGAFFRMIPHKRYALSLGSAVILSLILLNSKLFLPQTILPRSASFYTDKQALLWRTSKISDEFMPKNFAKPKYPVDVASEKVTIIAGDGKVTDHIERTQRITFGVDALTDLNVLVRIAPFPAWRMTVDGVGIDALDKNNGISFSLPQGKHVVSAEYKETAAQKFGNLLSLVGISFLVIGIINANRKEKI